LEEDEAQLWIHLESGAFVKICVSILITISLGATCEKHALTIAGDAYRAMHND